MPIDLGLIDGDYFADTHLDAIEAAINTSYTICTSGTRPGSPANGAKIYETDSKRLFIYDSGTAAWRLVGGSMPRVRVYKSAQSVADNTSTAVTWNDEVYDTDSFHTGAGSTLTAPITGYYHVGYSLQVGAGVATSIVQTHFTSSSGGGVLYGIDVRSNNATYGVIASGSSLIGLAAGDTVTLWVFHIGTSGSLNVGSTTLNSAFWATYANPV